MTTLRDGALLSDVERRFFDGHGYLVVEDALSTAEVSVLRAAVTRCGGTSEAGERNDADILGRDPAFLELVDHPQLLLRMAGVLGWNIWVNHTHINVSPRTLDTTAFAYRWHRDGGICRWDLAGALVPPMSVKVGVYLTDVSAPHAGQTYILPGTHRVTGPDNGLPDPQDSPPPHAIVLAVKPGTAVFYHPGIVHSLRSPNLSDTVRIAVFIQWAFRWLQPVDPQTVEHLDSQVTDPIRRQMLGLSTDATSGRTRYYTGRSGRYYPTRHEVPFRAQLEALGQHVGGWVR